MSDLNLADEIERYLAPDAIYHHWEPSIADMEQIITALRRCSSSDKVLVPKEPTEAMMRAVYEHANNGELSGCGWDELYKRVYRAMLAAHGGAKP